MKVFLRYVGEFLRSYPQNKLASKEEIQIRDASMRHLGLDNLNQLRDRYEGQAFFDKSMKNVGGLITCEKYLNFPVTDIDDINLKDFQPKIKIGDITYSINVFSFGELPLLFEEETYDHTLFVIRKDSLTFSICGIASPSVLQNNLIDSVTEKSSVKILQNFIGFKFLKSLNSVLEEINQIK